MINEAHLGQTIESGLCHALVEEINQRLNHEDASIARFSLRHLRLKDETTYTHSLSVGILMIALARQLGFSEHEVHEAGRAGLLHDIGKIWIPLHVLSKPDRLDSTEFDIVRTHVELGHGLLADNVHVSSDVMDACLHHHERFDGSGYLHGLKGNHIGRLARMVAICDVYDAVTSDRPYKDAWNPVDALTHMAEWQGQFDPFLFDAFVQTVGFYPLGSLVRLHSQQLAVVIEQNRDQLSRPVLRAFFCCLSRTPIPARVVDLSQASETDRIVSRENPAQWAFDNLNEPMQDGIVPRLWNPRKDFAK